MRPGGGGGEGGTPYNGLYGEVPPGRGTFYRLGVNERVGILRVEVYKRLGETVIYLYIFEISRTDAPN